MRLPRLLFAATLLTAMLFGSVAQARHVTVWYVDVDRPPEYAVEDVLAGIQRAMREWEAHNAGHALVLHWGGVRPLAGAPEDFNNVVIRWANTDYSAFVGVSCTYAAGCAGSPPTPTNHIFLASFWDFPTATPRTGRWNNPRYVPFSGSFNGMFAQDMVAVLIHEFAHLFRDIAGEVGPTSVLNTSTSFADRYLWTQDIFGVEHGVYDPHLQALQLFSLDGSNGSVTALRHWYSNFSVESPASLSVGDGVQGSGDYIIAYNTFDPTTQSDALLVKFTDGVANDVDRVIHATLNGADVGRTFHRPCVAVSAASTDYYLVWTSPIEGGGGWRQVLSMESHGDRGLTWSAPEVIPNAYTRSGVSCSIDRATERLVVAYSGAGEDGIWTTHRPSLTAGGGQWAAPKRLAGPTILGHLPSTYGPPDVAFDFFDTAVQGIVSWQDNADLKVHSVSLTFSAGDYVPGSTSWNHFVDRSVLRSWPIVSFENVPVLGSSLYVGTNHGEERRSFPGWSFFLDGEAYTVGAIHAARRYTGAASNRIWFARAFLSTANTGL